MKFIFSSKRMAPTPSGVSSSPSWPNPLHTNSIFCCCCCCCCWKCFLFQVGVWKERILNSSHSFSKIMSFQLHGKFSPSFLMTSHRSRSVKGKLPDFSFQQSVLKSRRRRRGESLSIIQTTVNYTKLNYLLGWNVVPVDENWNPAAINSLTFKSWMGG